MSWSGRNRPTIQTVFAERRRPTLPIPAAVVVALVLLCVPPSASAQSTPVKPNVPTDTAGPADGVVITKMASRSTVRRGEVVTYTVSVTNNGSRDFLATNPTGGVLFQDLPPTGFRYVTASARLAGPSGPIAIGPPPNDASGALLFGQVNAGAQPGGIPLRQGQSLRLTYQLRVGARVQDERSYANRVFVRTPNGEALSENAVVTVRVEADPEFDMGAVLGRVFCDDDGNGIPTAGEAGVGGVRIYGDHGWKGTSDRLGKWHLRRLRPGNHLIKLDKASLPAGSKLVTDEKFVIYVTPGLVVKRDFGVKCNFKDVSPTGVVRPRKTAGSDSDEVVVPKGPLGDLVTVAGNLTALTMSVDGVSLSPMAVSMRLRGPTLPGENNFRNGTRNVPWSPGVLRDPLVFDVKMVGGPLVRSWAFQIFRTDGGREQLVREKIGTGRPPKTLKWAGTDATGVLGILERSAIYEARLTIADGDGGGAISGSSVFGVSYGSPVRAVVAKSLRGRNLFKKDMTVGSTLKREFKKLRGAFKANPGARLLIGVHTGDSGMAETDAGRSRRGAFQASQAAQKALGLPANRVLSVGYGSTQPLRPVLSKRDNDYNRRVELTVLPPERPQQLQAPTKRPVKPEVVVQGLKVPLGGESGYARTVTRPTSGQVAIALTNAKGQRRWALATVAPASKSDVAPPKTIAPQPKKAPAKTVATKTKTPGKKVPPSATAVPEGDSRGEISVDATMRKPGSKKAPKPGPNKIAGAARPAKPKLTLQRADAKPTKKSAKPIAEDPLRRFGGEALRRALGAKSVLLDTLNQDKPVTAGELTVKLPPKGLKIGTKRLFIPGKTSPKNRVTINGQKVHVGPSGVFSTTVPLPIGKSNVVIESVDKAGNKARIEWPVEVAKSEFFLMAIADGVLGHKGAKLAERERYYDIKFGDGFASLGGALYVKGRVSGLGIAKDLLITAHLDSTKGSEFNAFYEQVIDPAKDYFVLGDSAGEEQDVKARGPLYLLVELDKSKLTVGNVKTDFEGVELFRYNRNFYGIHLDFNKAFAEGFDTRVKAFITDDQKRLVRGHDEMRGTGGSIYYLSKKDVAKGSETLNVVVREMTTGMELGRHTLVRDRDYRIDYSDGRIFMKTPLSSTMDSLFSLSGFQPFNGRDLMDGHEIWLDAQYESRDTSAGADLAWGVHASQRIFKYVEVGGGYLREGRDGGADYEHMGAHIKVDLNKTSRAYFEFAQSLNSDGSTRQSSDGGLTFKSLKRAKADEDYGWAMKAGLTTHVGDLAGMGKDLDLTIKGWYQLMQPGFHSVGARQEQGMEKWGGQVRYNPTDKDMAIIRLDWMTALVADSAFDTGYRAVKRNRFQLLYRHTEKDWRVGVEAAYGQHRDDDDGNVFDTGAFSVMGGYKIIPQLEITLSQSFMIGGDDQELGPDAFSRLATTIGATWQLDEDFALSIAEEIRWNGDNATRFGLRTKLSSTANLYIEERIRSDSETGRMIGATVLGAEQRLPGGGRMYGEYRLDGGVSGRTNQAVFGIAKRFTLSEGVKLSAAYERMQTLGAWEGVGARDVVSAGLEILIADFIKYGGRYELRWDRAGDLDQMQTVLRNGLNLKIGDAVTIFANANYILTQDLTTRKVKGEHLDASVAIAVRPPDMDWLTIGTRWARQIRRNPLALEGFDKLGLLERDERTITDLFSLTAIFELPFRLQLSERFAFRHSEERVTGLPEAVYDYFIWINRLGFHLVENFDVAAEYRLLYTLTTDDIEHGALVEVAYNIMGYARIGVGFNFSSFSDNLMSDLDEDASGFFVRLTGTY